MTDETTIIPVQLTVAEWRAVLRALFNQSRQMLLGGGVERSNTFEREIVNRVALQIERVTEQHERERSV